MKLAVSAELWCSVYGAAMLAGVLPRAEVDGCSFPRERVDQRAGTFLHLSLDTSLKSRGRIGADSVQEILGHPGNRISLEGNLFLIPLLQRFGLV